MVSAALLAGAGGGAGAALALGHDNTVTKVVTTPAGATTTASSTAGGALTVNGVYRQAKQGVVDITATTDGGGGGPLGGGGGGGSKAEGSGFVIDKKGDVVTNNHVVSGANSLQVKFADGKTASARVVGTDPSSDLAVIRVSVDSSELQPLTLADSSKVQVGDGVVAIGSPFGLPGSVTVGVVSALGRSITAPNHSTIAGAIQTDAPINHGNSGGPLLNTQGQVIGVNSQIESDSGDNSGVGFAIPSSTVSRVASQLASGEKVQHPFLGVDLTDGENGATVQAVVNGSPADKAKVERGDVITAVDGTAVRSSEEAVAAIAGHKPGDHITISLRRGNASMDVQATLTSRS